MSIDEEDRSSDHKKGIAGRVAFTPDISKLSTTQTDSNEKARPVSKFIEQRNIDK